MQQVIDERWLKKMIKKYEGYTDEDYEQEELQRQADYEDAEELLFALKVYCKVEIPQNGYEEKYYVYATYADGVLVYVGSGKGDRYKHNCSGVSHNKKLNELYFSGSKMSVLILRQGLTQEQSLVLEKRLIAFYNPTANTIGKTKMLYRDGSRGAKSPYMAHLLGTYRKVLV